jgi:hypothetical protein
VHMSALSNCESKDHRASASRVHVSRFPRSPYRRAAKPLTIPLAGGFWRAGFVTKVACVLPSAAF